MRVCAAAPFDAALTLRGSTSRDARWRPHDLLRLARLASFDEEPAWARDAFARAPFVVVRRACVAEGFVATGLRGAERAQRYGTWTHVSDIEACVSPETLRHVAPRDRRDTLPAFMALAALVSSGSDSAGVLNGFTWGPTGSVGFELATHVPAVKTSSDLDLLIRTPMPLTRDTAQALVDHLQAIARRVDIRIDAQLETPAGGVALAEWAARKMRVLVRGASGPELIADPWAAGTAEAS